MKTIEKSIKNRFSVIVFTAAILIFGTSSIYGQEAGRDAAPAASTANAEEINSVNKDFCRHEFSTWIGGGYFSLNYKPTFGGHDLRFGGILGLGYAVHFNPHWSLGIGAEIGLYNAKMTVNNLTDNYSINDQDGDAIRYYTKIDRYAEKQRLYTVNIPIWLQYQTPINNSGHEFYTALGFKLGVPFSAKYKSDEALFSAYGYYEKWDQTLYDQRDLGYGANTGKILEEKLNIDLSYMGSIEAGMKWNSSNLRTSFYTGIYLDYGFNDLMKTHNTKFLDYNYQNPENFNTNSVLTSEYARYGEINNFADKVSTFAVGLKVRVGFNSGNVKKERQSSKQDRLAVIEKGIAEIKNSLEETPKEPEEIIKESLPLQKRTALEQTEYDRATAEYGDLTDVFTLQIDGYEVNQIQFSKKMEMLLDIKISELQRYNNSKFEIICEGHTCNLGKGDYNMWLAHKRADAVRYYLIKNGFNGDNIVVVSKGATTPIVQNVGEANRKINRRVVFIIKNKR